MADYSWMLTEPVYVALTGAGAVVLDTSGAARVTLKLCDCRTLLFDGEYWDAGDDLTAYLSLIDDAVSRGAVVGGPAVITRPYREI